MIFLACKASYECNAKTMACFEARRLASRRSVFYMVVISGRLPLAWSIVGIPVLHSSQRSAGGFGIDIDKGGDVGGLLVALTSTSGSDLDA